MCVSVFLSECVCVCVCVQVHHPGEGDCEFNPTTLSIVRNIWRISLPDGTTDPGEEEFFYALLV